MANAVKFRHTVPPRQQGEVARLKISHGVDAGTIHVVTGGKALIGRGENNDVVISDLKASRVHAELMRSTAGWMIRDVGSANGIVHNGRLTRSANLKTGDVVTIGETMIEFVESTEAGTYLLTAPVKSAAQIQAEQAALNFQKRKLSMGALASLGGGGDKKRTVLIAVAAVAVLFLIFAEDPADKKPRKKPPAPKNEQGRDLASYISNINNRAVSKTADMFFHSGFREYRERNYLRAKRSFETVLQMAPGHELATRYLEGCDKEIEEEVKFNLEHGKKSFEAGKIKSARAHYEAILRLLYKDQKHPAYAEAKSELEKLRKTALEGGGG